jgi:hypothetical protein
VDAASADRPGESPAVAVDNPSRRRMRMHTMLTNSASSMNSSPSSSASFAARGWW